MISNITYIDAYTCIIYIERETSSELTFETIYFCMRLYYLNNLIFNSTSNCIKKHMYIDIYIHIYFVKVKKCTKSKKWLKLEKKVEN